MTDPDAYAAELDDWHAARMAELAAEDGWLNVTDRIEVAPGRHAVGSGPGADLRISTGPERAGILTLDPDGTAVVEVLRDHGQEPVEPAGARGRS